MIRIDKHKIYESHGYLFINFVDISKEQKEMILSWRNSEKVRNMMVNTNPISLEEHLKFIEGLKERTDCYYWIVVDPIGVDIGVLDVIHVDYDKDEGEIGYYINPNEAGIGFEFMKECNFFVFSQLKLRNNLVTVNVNNRDILLFTKYLGSSFESIETIGTESFFVNKHGCGDYLIQHYDELSLLDYARFVRKYKSINLKMLQQQLLIENKNIRL